ncbi:hypothetical protein NEOLEDRAFT_1182335 [Neolentinus lepideus HHB14362 ss-1]|uniref:Uncharacterized protein n=1 Tax=Neolentinus lepideus HHB14362 ss-1 TaxID=1314782 RepID=A0A165P9S4_9AGAM|nr:hypothetical protein NEOLEDRAFT_1182335 [Neolentinus lepideus HHB14362 ss-1]
MAMTSSEIAQPAGDNSEGGTLRKLQGKLVEMPKDTRTAKQLFQKEQFNKGNVTDAQFRKMWKELPDDGYSNRATAMSRAAGGADGTTNKLRGRNKAKEYKV